MHDESDYASTPTPTPTPAHDATPPSAEGSQEERARGPRRTRFPGRNMASRLAKGRNERKPRVPTDDAPTLTDETQAHLNPDSEQPHKPRGNPKSQQHAGRTRTGPNTRDDTRPNHRSPNRPANRTNPRTQNHDASPAHTSAEHSGAADHCFAAVVRGEFDAWEQEQAAAAESALSSQLQGDAPVAAQADTEQDAVWADHDDDHEEHEADGDAESDPLGDELAQLQQGKRPRVHNGDKRVLRPEPEQPKLHKILAQSGMGSRLDMEQLILEGRISVNNEPAHIGQRIQYGDQIRINGKPLRYRIAPPATRVLAYHKPAGEVVTQDDPQNRPTVFRALPRLQQGKWQSVGRLDLNTEGLLLFSNSGDLVNRLTHPRFGLEREYAVRVLGALDDAAKQQLLQGITLDDGPAKFNSLHDGGGEGANCWYRVTIAEGRYREVRRMFEALGHAVSRLIRIRYGKVVLPKGLRRGAWLELDEATVQQLGGAVGLHPAPARAPRKGAKPGKGATPYKPTHPGADPSGNNRPQRSPYGSTPHVPRHGRANHDERGSKMEDRIARALQASVNAMSDQAGPVGATMGAAAYQDANRPRRGPGARKPYSANPMNASPFAKSAKPSRNPNGAGKGANKGHSGGQPDPMRTSVGYLAAGARGQGRAGRPSAGRLGGGRMGGPR